MHPIAYRTWLELEHDASRRFGNSMLRSFAIVEKVKGTSRRTVVQHRVAAEKKSSEIVIENSNETSFNTSHGASKAANNFLSNFNRPSNWEIGELYGRIKETCKFVRI
jgi:hypothetical protein